ncbi:CLUMA_CG004229, isoform A [Clunio marinus]|uniref:CLUMA_CG004229, isoform A n=1 Tax=Clunio marinus TaxID=568069 RepID=A0A1J1HSF0_9DIPT|nr:CLUMA_CG004229, isoform A [Clunio marinus]
MDVATKKQKHAECLKAYRQRDYEAKKGAGTLRQKEKREFIKANNPEKYAEAKKADKERKKNNAASSQSSFPNGQARACRINYQLNLLPKDEAMRKEIVLGMAKKLGLNVGPLPQALSSNALDPTVVKSATDFYSNDKISRIPNANAVVPIEKGGAETTSLRFMTCTIQEAMKNIRKISHTTKSALITLEIVAHT